MGSSRLQDALNELDPGSRAVVDLSLGTDFSDENIATLIRVEPDEVVRRRERAIDLIAASTGEGSRRRVVEELCELMGIEPSKASSLEPDGRISSEPNGNGNATAVAVPAALEQATESEPSPDHPTEPESALDPDAEPAAGRGDEPEPEPGAIAETEPGTARPAESELDAVPDAAVATEPEPATEPELEGRSDIPPPPAPGAPASAAHSRRRRGLLALLAIAAIAAVVGFVAISGSGTDDGPGDAPAPADEAPVAESPSVPEAPAALTALPDAPAAGSVELTSEGERLTLELDGLPAPRGDYEAWLFTSVLDSRSLGSIDEGSGEISFELPSGADRFESLDVTIQPSRAAAHSGRSIYRLPVSELPAG